MARCRRCRRDAEAGSVFCLTCKAEVKRLAAIESSRTDLDDGPRRPPLIDRNTGIVVGIIGVLLLLFGTLQWTSMASQISRSLGQPDHLGVGLLLGGAMGVLAGMYGVFFASPSQPDLSVTPNASAEGRLRQLDDLRSKGLITDDQYEDRKNQIISSL